jgi:hypothetical protein
MMNSAASIIDVLFENLFVVIILVNLFFRIFVKKTEEEPLATSEIDRFDPDQTDDDAWEDFADDSLSPSSSSHDYVTQSDAHSHFDEDVADQIRSLIDFTKESFKDDDSQLRQLEDITQKHPGLHILIPSLAHLYREVLTSQETARSELKRIERAFYERATLSVLSDMQKLLNRVGRCSEETHLVYGLSQSFSVRLSDTQLAYRLLIDQLEPFKRHRDAEGADLATYPLPAPQIIGRYHNQLRRYAQGRFNWFVTDYDHLDDIGTWPLQARMSAYVLSEITSDWSREWRRWCGGIRKAQLPTKAFRQLHWEIEDSLNVWGEQLLSAYIMALRYGPAAARALLIEANQSQNQEKLIYVGADQEQSRQQTAIAPFMFEFEVVLVTLRQMGFHREADAAKAKWLGLVGKEFKCRIAGGSVITLPLESIKEDVKRWCLRLSEQKWATWNGERLSEIVGLTCTRGMWSLAETHARQLVEGEKLSSLPDHIHWLTVINIAQAYPEYVAHAWRLTERYLAHHLPLGLTDQDTDIDTGEVTQDDLIAALVLSDIFERRSFNNRRAH